MGVGVTTEDLDGDGALELIAEFVQPDPTVSFRVHGQQRDRADLNVQALAFDKDDLIASADGVAPPLAPGRRQLDRAAPGRGHGPDRRQHAHHRPRNRRDRRRRLGPPDERQHVVARGVRRRRRRRPGHRHRRARRRRPGPGRDRRGVHRLGRLGQRERPSISRGRTHEATVFYGTATGERLGARGRVRRPRTATARRRHRGRARRGSRARPDLRRVRPAQLPRQSSDRPLVHRHRRGHRLDHRDGRRRAGEARSSPSRRARGIARSSSRRRRARWSRTCSPTSGRRRRRRRPGRSTPTRPTTRRSPASRRRRWRPAISTGSPPRASRSTSRSAIRAYRHPSDTAMRRGKVYLFANVAPTGTAPIDVASASPTITGQGQELAARHVAADRRHVRQRRRSVRRRARRRQHRRRLRVQARHRPPPAAELSTTDTDTSSRSRVTSRAGCSAARSRARARAAPTASACVSRSARPTSAAGSDRVAIGAAYLYKADTLRKFRIFEQVYGKDAGDALGTSVAGGQLDGRRRRRSVAAAPNAAGSDAGTGVVYVRYGSSTPRAVQRRHGGTPLRTGRRRAEQGRQAAPDRGRVHLEELRERLLARAARQVDVDRAVLGCQHDQVVAAVAVDVARRRR